jgi:hypothetical protein
MEVWQIITADGITYDLSAFSKVQTLLVTPSGLGLPPVEYRRTRFYQQDGASELAYFLLPRSFALQFRSAACDRNEYWQVRKTLLQAVRPNRNGQLTLRCRLADGSKYDIKARALSPTFVTSADSWDEFAVTDSMDMEAIDPLFYASDSITQTGVAPVGGDLVFPFKFPFAFAEGNTFSQITVNYTGTWHTYPKITLQSPFTSVTIQNRTTGIILDWTGSYPFAGKTLTIDLRNSYDSNGDFVGVRIYDELGNDEYNKLGPTSNLLNLRIEPAPIAPGGVNVWNFIAFGTDSATTSFQMEYQTAYIGI